jgi:hypothetical protein
MTQAPRNRGQEERKTPQSDQSAVELPRQWPSRPKQLKTERSNAQSVSRIISHLADLRNQHFSVRICIGHRPSKVIIGFCVLLTYTFNVSCRNAVQRVESLAAGIASATQPLLDAVSSICLKTALDGLSSGEVKVYRSNESP